jgi:hypothetical protein
MKAPGWMPVCGCLSNAPQPGVALPDWRVGVDVGVRCLARVATVEGTVIEHVANPRPLDAALRERRHVSRARARCTKGSRRSGECTTEMSGLHRRVNNQCLHASPARPDDTIGSNPRLPPPRRGASRVITKGHTLATARRRIGRTRDLTNVDCRQCLRQLAKLEKAGKLHHH